MFAQSIILLLIAIVIVINKEIDFCSFNGISRNLDSKNQCLLTGNECCVVEWVDNTKNYYLCFNQTEIKLNSFDNDVLYSYKKYFLNNLFSNKQLELASKMIVLCNSTNIALIKNDL